MFASQCYFTDRSYSPLPEPFLQSLASEELTCANTSWNSSPWAFSEINALIFSFKLFLNEIQNLCPNVFVSLYAKPWKFIWYKINEGNKCWPNWSSRYYMPVIHSSLQRQTRVWKIKSSDVLMDYWMFSQFQESAEWAFHTPMVERRNDYVQAVAYQSFYDSFRYENQVQGIPPLNIGTSSVSNLFSQFNRAFNLVRYQLLLTWDSRS